MHILIVEDEKHLAATLADVVRTSGYTVDISYDGTIGISQIETGRYDAVILDVMLPGKNGFEVLQQIRTGGIMTPVLLLTARTALNDRIRGLDSGADYYLTKPFDNGELLACLRTIIRRQSGTISEMHTFGDLTLIPSVSQLNCGEHTVLLRAKELALMQLLIQNQNQILPKETIFIKVWGYDSNVSSNCVEAYISFLRKKFSFLGSTVQITSVRNIGYKLEEASC